MGRPHKHVVALSNAALYRQLDSIADYFRANVSHDAARPWSGWHNMFANRIGTAGSAVPLLFFQGQGEHLDCRDKVLTAILGLQRTDGGWSILSLADVAIVEASSWCVQALAVCGGPTARDAIRAGENWLLSNQQSDGGWGSNGQNKSRTLTTCVALDAICSLDAPDRSRVRSGLGWLVKTQRNDGSWGAAPGDDGTLFHTAEVVRTLRSLGLLGANDPHVVRGSAWLLDRWEARTSRWVDETYEVHTTKGYNKVPLVHDVDAALVRAFVACGSQKFARQIGPRLAILHQEFLRDGVIPSGRSPSIWNIVPTGFALQEYLRSAGASADGSTVYFFGMSASFKESVLHPRARVARVLLRNSIPSPRTVILLAGLMLAVLILILFVRGDLSGKELLTSIGVEVIGIPVALLAERRVNG